jgi:hypothetical protein
LHETGDKKSVTKNYETFLARSYIFLCFWNVSVSRALAASFTTFWGLPEPDLITQGAGSTSYGLSHTAKKPTMRLLTVLMEDTVCPQ